MKIGIFGGAFNPPTKAHAHLIKESAKQLDEIWIIPSYSHAFGKKLISFEERIGLLRIFKKNLKEKNIKILKIEKDLNKENKKDFIYTYDLLKKLKSKFPENEFIFICGEDNAKKEVWEKFYKSKEIDNEFSKIVIKETMQVRSTIARELIKEGSYKELEKYLFKNVIRKIKERKFYKKNN